MIVNRYLPDLAAIQQAIDDCVRWLRDVPEEIRPRLPIAHLILALLFERNWAAGTGRPVHRIRDRHSNTAEHLPS